MEIDFEWDPVKARKNWKKHGISFARAASIFHDPLAISIPDADHSNEVEERWITIGADRFDVICVVCHTSRDASQTRMCVRIISARKATKKERKHYQGSEAGDQP